MVESENKVSVTREKRIRYKGLSANELMRDFISLPDCKLLSDLRDLLACVDRLRKL